MTHGRSGWGRRWLLMSQIVRRYAAAAWGIARETQTVVFALCWASAAELDLGEASPGAQAASWKSLHNRRWRELSLRRDARPRAGRRDDPRTSRHVSRLELRSEEACWPTHDRDRPTGLRILKWRVRR